jgi:hypothetical protein
MLIVSLLVHHETSLFLMLSFSRLSTIILPIGRSGTHVSSALTGDIRTGGDRGLFEYAAALIDVNESAGRRGAGHVRQVEGSDTGELEAAQRDGSALSALQDDGRRSLALGSCRSV